MQGLRRTIICATYEYCAKFQLLSWGILVNEIEVDEDEVDYSHYLGPDYKTNFKQEGRVSTYVCNHTSVMDPVVLIQALGGMICFIVGIFVKSIPICGVLCSGIDCIWAPRTGTSEAKEKAV